MKYILLNIFLLVNTLLSQQDSGSIYNNPGLKDLINSAIINNSKLEPIEYEKKILSAAVNTVNQQSAPMAQVMVDNLPVNFMNPGEYIFTYSQPLKLFGKLDAQENLAVEMSKKPDIDRKELEIDLIKSIKENYYLLSLNERLMSFNIEYRQILEGITKSIEIRYSAGKGSQYEILKSNNEYQKLLLEEITLKNDRLILINNLALLSGKSLSYDFATKNVDLLFQLQPPELDSSRLFTDAKIGNTEFQFLDQQNEENNAELNIAKLERKPDIELMPGYKYMTEIQESFLLFSVSVEMPFMPWNAKRIKAEITEKDLMRKKINSEIKSLEVNLKNEIKNTVQKINSAQEKITYLSRILIPQTEQTFKSSLISYETAAVQFSDLLDTYRVLRENNEMLVKEETGYLILISSLEKLTGKQILTIN
ncbi:MAG TPA: TolC family protein [Ignavibacteria bacterium]|nr:TolC family protein [Ignavibacteria bacterium]